MTGFPGAARPVRGGFVLLAPDTGRPLRTVPFQYNPDSLTRTVQAQGIGPEPGDRLEAQRLKGPAHETYKFEAEFDAAEQLADPAAHPAEAESGLLPVLCALESGLHPTVAQLVEEDRMAALGLIEVAPVEAPLTVLVLGRSRVLPVRLTEFSVTEEAFDTSLAPIRAKVSVGARVLTVDDLGFRHPGGLLYLQHHRARERFADRVTRTPSDLGLTGL
ncbi:hypothetical protein GCM10010302_64960 [Streptomyces polychromogenes]|uniref:Uncharacterized protein n=1 Tax=Streptomyces polychromogenes TaxID=67342 RepID=A0ABN0VTG1_9ACTN